MDPSLERIAESLDKMVRLMETITGVRYEPTGPAFWEDPERFPYRFGESEALTDARVALCETDAEREALFLHMEAVDRKAAGLPPKSHTPLI